MAAVVLLDGVSFAWPDGSLVLDGISGTFGAGRTGLVGRNGTGKTTLLRLIAGELRPTSGAVRVTGTIGYLAQHRDRLPGSTVADALGLSEVLAAQAAIEAGSLDPAHFETLDGNWDLPDRIRATLDATGLPFTFDRPATSLSGGEWATVCLLGVMAREPDVLILDEPTNDLDTVARTRLYGLLDDWLGTAIVVSHDRELLERVDAIAEIRGHALRTVGGPYSHYTQIIAAEQEAADGQLRSAEQLLRREERQLAEAQTKIARSNRKGEKDRANNRRPKIVAGTLERKAQASAGKLRDTHTAAIAAASEARSLADERARRDDEVRIELAGTAVPAGKVVATMTVNGSPMELRGPERVALTGPNGSGKTTLLDALVGRRDSPSFADARITVPVGYLDQHLTALDSSLSVLENVRLGCPDRPIEEIRAQLARLLIRGDEAHQPVATLSGGQRFRAALARVLLADPAPQLLVLDEPTNNLDIATVEQLTEALDAYGGALIVASHDGWLLDRLRVDRTITLP